MANTVSEDDIKAALNKSNKQVLLSEMLVGQNLIDEVTLKKLSRQLLLKLVTHLRKTANQVGQVKSLIIDYKLDEDLAKEVEKFVDGPQVEEQQPQSESAKMLVTFMQMMQQERKDRQEERRLKEEKEEKDKKAKEEKEVQDKKDRQEARRLKEEKEEQDKKDRREAMRIKDEKDEKDKKDRRTELENRDRKVEEDRLALLESLKDVHTAVMKKDENEEKRKKEESQKRDTRMTKAIKLTRTLLYEIPTDPVSLIIYFRNIDQIFETNEIQDDLKINLLNAHLTEKMRKVLAGIPQEDKEDYPKWKASLLREYQVTPRKCKKSFMKAFKTKQESCIQFLARLRTLFTCYLETRELPKTYDALLELVVTDKFKESLTKDERLFIADKEASGYMKGIEVAKYVDLFQMERADNDDEVSRRSEYRNTSYSRSSNRDSRNWDRNRSRSSYSNNLNSNSNRNYGHKNNTEYYNKDHHTSKDYNNKNVNSDIKGKTEVHKHHGKVVEHSKSVKPQIMKTKLVEAVTSSEEEEGREESDENSVVSSDSTEDEIKEVNRMRIENVDSTLREVVGNANVVGTSASKKLTLSNSKELVTVNFGLREVVCLIDSGSDISILKPDMIEMLENDQETADTTITLQSAFGQKTKAKLKNVTAQLCNTDNKQEKYEKVVLLCAITPMLKDDIALLTPDDYEVLKTIQNETVASNTEYISDTRFLCQKDNTKEASIKAYEVKLLGDEQVLETKQVDLVEFQAEEEKNQEVAKINFEEESQNDFKQLQLDDQTLNKYWKALKEGQGKFVVEEENGLLFRNKKIGGIEIRQLVVPKVKRTLLLNQAHASLAASHLGIQKTMQRLQLYYTWPNLKKDVENFVGSCNSCQKMRKQLKADKVKIKAIPRSNVAFQDIAIDLIGEIVPNSSGQHKYILVVIDMFSRWTEAVPLKNLSAKEVCRGLLEVFGRTAFPKSISADNGSNFTAQLSKELYSMLGIKIKHSSPYHPEGNSVIERFNATLKKLLHHVINGKKPKDWHNQLHFLLASYREVPHRITGISPYQMVYGRVCRGPMAVIRDIWIKEKEQTSEKQVDMDEYLKKLQDDLQLAADLANDNCEKNQKKYIDHYNVTARNKNFVVGEKVIVLMKDSTNKLKSRWRGPCQITAVLSENSYRVLMEDGGVRNFHANHLRHYLSRVNNLGVIYEADNDLGEISYCLDEIDKKSSKQTEIENLDLSYLNNDQSKELRNLLLKYKEVFSDDPGNCNVMEHEINLKEGFVPKKQNPYRIPEKLRDEVERQINELLKLGKIRPSNSVYQHPLLCVAKPDGSIRLCTDLRQINSGIKTDSYPIPRMEDLLMKVSEAIFLTKLDCSQGYFQLKLKDEDCHKTAFVSPSGFWEWVYLPFGLKTAQSGFMRVMDEILRPHSKYARCFVDDSIVFSKMWDKHMKDLEAVLNAFKEAGMTLKLKKCEFAKHKVNFVGNLVGEGVRRPLESKIEIIKNMPEPTTKKGVRSFIGMVNFFRGFIKNFSQVMFPITELTKNNRSNRVKFNDEERNAFEQIKKLLCDCTNLYAPNYEKEFILRSDASDTAIGACLLQKDDEGNEQPIAFLSSKLNETQRNWKIVVKEAYAIVYSLKKWGYIIYNSHVTVYCDNNPLHYIINSTPTSPKLIRWSISLSKFDITVIHVKGTENLVADHLSRL